MTPKRQRILKTIFVAEKVVRPWLDRRLRPCRQETVELLRTSRVADNELVVSGTDPDHCLAQMEKDGTWGRDGVMLSAAATLYRVSIKILMDDGNSAFVNCKEAVDDSAQLTVDLCRCLRPAVRITLLAYCVTQSLLQPGSWTSWQSKHVALLPASRDNTPSDIALHGDNRCVVQTSTSAVPENDVCQLRQQQTH